MEENKGTKAKLLSDINLYIIFIITLMSVMPISSTQPAFVLLPGAFAPDAVNIPLIITVFILPGIFFNPVFGVLADRYGRKKVLVPALLIFGIGGGLCGFATSFEMLLLFVFIQGIGASSLGALNITLIGDLYGDERRVRAMGYNQSVSGIGTAVYPLLGGLLAGISWNWPFFLPFTALIAALLVALKLKNPEPRQNAGLKEYFRSMFRIAFKSEALVLLIYSAVPFIFLFGVILAFLHTLFTKNFEVGVFQLGTYLSVLSFSAVISSAMLGRFSKKARMKTILALAFLLYALSMALIPFINNVWLMYFPVAIYGIAHGINMPGIKVLLTSIAPENQRAAFMSLSRMAALAGQALGPVIMALAYGLGGINAVFYAGALIAALMIVPTVLLFKK